MMKNTLIVERDGLAQAYAESAMEHIQDGKNGMHLVEYAGELKQLGDDIQRMLSNDLEDSRKAFHDAFQSGFTMMMLADQFDALEAWSRAGEDFQIAVFTAEGKPVGTFSQDTVQW
jgi:hypothetical protein